MEQRWRMVTAACLLLALFVGAWGISQWDRARRTEQLLAAQYYRAFFDLIAHAESVAVLLAKSRAAGSPGEAVLHLTDAWKQALLAQAHLNALPLSPLQRERTSVFLTQAGDYAYRAALVAARGNELSEEHWETLARLERQAEDLTRQLQAILARASTGQLRWQEVQSRSRGRLAGGRASANDRENDREDVRDGSTGVGESFTRIEDGMAEYPTLLYDGPFSDHVTRREPRALPEETVSVERAQAVAAEFLSAALDRTIQADEVEPIGQIEGEVPAYRFHLDEGDRRVRIDVSRHGGMVLLMLDPRAPERARLSGDEGIARGRRFLHSIGFEAVEPMFPLRAGERMLVPFAPVQDGIPLYPDQIKLSVSLEDGAILSYYAMDYVMNHVPRDIPEPAVSEAAAREALSPRLADVDEGRLVWMADEALREYLAYEFAARDTEGEAYLVYVDAVTGEELRVEKLIRTEEGLLAM